MYINKGNTVIYGYIPAKNIIGNMLNVEKTFTQKVKVRIKGNKEDGSFAKIVVRWEPSPFYDVFYYQDILPQLFRVFRRVYNSQGFLRKAIFKQVIEEELTKLDFNIAIKETKNPTQIHCKTISKEKTIIFPTTLEVLWRPSIFVCYTSEVQKKLVHDGFLILESHTEIYKNKFKNNEYTELNLPQEEFEIIKMWENKEKAMYNYKDKFLVILRPKEVRRRIKMLPNDNNNDNIIVIKTSRKTKL